MPFGEFQVHGFAPSDNCPMYHSHSQRVGFFWGGPEFHIHVFQIVTLEKKREFQIHILANGSSYHDDLI